MDLARLRPARQILRHEAKLNHRPHARLLEGVEHLIENLEVVHRFALRIQGEDIRRTPLQLRHAVARCKQVMRAYVNRYRAEIVQLGKQLLAIFHGGVVRFVIAEPAIDWLIGAQRLIEIYLDSDSALRRSGKSSGTE